MTARAAKIETAEVRLPALREDLTLLEGPREADGSPTWTVHDPVRQRFFRIGRAGFEFLSRWHLGSAQGMLAAVAAETTLVAGPEELDDFTRFLAHSDLLRAEQPQMVQQLLAKAEAARLSWPRWLLHHYLFVRIPLVRPDAFLTATLPMARLVFHPIMLRLVLGIGAVGIVLALRQWDAFLHTFQHFFSAEGAVAFAVTLSLVKVVHELGHGYAAKSFGCRVPTMGLALLVLWPVLYTDASDAWRLVSRQQRLLIGVAGVATELGLALIATFLWSFLPDGPARSAAFLVATTTWVSTLAVNLSPFMRFDGYYLLSDWLSVSNLQHRSFALARWQLRRWIFAFDEPEPEPFPPATRRALLVYAWATWTYRAVVFLGIAFLVYHFFFKVLGIILMAVELAWFLALPVTNELREWWRRRRAIRLSPNLVAALAVLTGGVWLLATPWQTRVGLPAIERAASYVTLYPPVPSRVASVEVVPGHRVAAGDILFRLEAPELDHRLDLIKKKIAVVALHLDRQAANSEDMENLPALQQEMAALLSNQAGLTAEQDNLILRAPFAGLITDLAPELRPGLWVKPDQPFGRLVNPEKPVFVAYLSGADLNRVHVGASGQFLPEDIARRAIPVVVIDIEQVNASVLDTPALASTQGGPIAVQPPGKTGALVPTSVIYRITLTSLAPMPAPIQVLAGTVLVEGNARSLVARIFREVAAVLVRESEF